MIRVWLTRDPETDRVSMQLREFSDGDFPPGKRGRGWPIRVGEIDADIWPLLLSGELPPDEQDSIHEDTWNEASTP